MASFPNKPSKPEDESSKRLDREVRDMVATLTEKVNKLHSKTKVGESEPNNAVNYVGDDENGVSILTLAGTNTGATMRSNLDDKRSENLEVLGSGTYANSNCQAVNNSIMMHAKYTSEDPGIHISILEYDEYDEEEHGKGKGKHKEKKKEKQLEKTTDGEEWNYLCMCEHGDMIINLDSTRSK